MTDQPATEMPEDDLALCPFCKVSQIELTNAPLEMKRYACAGCLCYGPPGKGSEHAAQLWNTRPAPALPADRAEALNGIKVICQQARDHMTAAIERLVDAEVAALNPLTAQPERADAEPVAWRWKPKGSGTWIYDPKIEWLEKQDPEAIDKEPVYTTPPATPTPEEIAECVFKSFGREWSWTDIGTKQEILSDLTALMGGGA